MEQQAQPPTPTTAATPADAASTATVAPPPAASTSTASAPPSKPQAFRRPHHKSRLGCVQCKQRKIKCGEEKPQCEKCIRYNTPCSFLNLQASKPSDGSSSKSSPNAHSSTSAGPSSRTPPNAANPNSLPLLGAPETFTIQDLEFLHNYTTNTWHTISQLHFWQTAVPSIAVSYPFLMHGVLALGASHLAYLRPAQRKIYLAASTRHHHLALTGYRGALAAITPQNCHACAAFSLLLSVFAWACPDRRGTLFLSEPDSDSVEPIGILRGGNAVMAGWKHIIADGPLGPLYRPWFGWNADQEAFTRLPSVQSLLQRSEETSPVLPQEDDARLERLSRLWCGKIPPVHPNPHIAQHVNDLPSPISTATHPHSPASATLPFTQLNGSGSALTPTIVNVLEHTLKLLRRVFVVTSTNTIIEPQAASLCWPIVIPDAFIDMVQAHNPYALVLLAHYCILLKRNDSRWWIEGKAEELLHKIRILLDREAGAERWEDWILWPVAEVGEMGMGSSRGGSQGGSRATSLAGTPGSAVVLEGGVALAPMQVEDVRMRDR